MIKFFLLISVSSKSGQFCAIFFNFCSGVGHVPATKSNYLISCAPLPFF